MTNCLSQPEVILLFLRSKALTIRAFFSLRTLKDADAIKRQRRKNAKELTLIGGGLLGLEAGNGICKSGIKITVIEFFPRLLPRQMDVSGAAMLQNVMENMGFKFLSGCKKLKK